MTFSRDGGLRRIPHQASPSLENSTKSVRKGKKKQLFAFFGIVLLILILASTLPVALFLAKGPHEASTEQLPSGATNHAAHDISLSAREAKEKLAQDWRANSRNNYHALRSRNPKDASNKNIDNIPHWMKEYFQWHAAARQKLNEDHDAWKSFRYLMLQCLPGSRKCGGTADRLKPLPLMLWMAHQSQRILLIKWGRPAELEEFLLPPEGGMDWRVPDWLFQRQDFRQGPRATNVEELQEMTANAEFTMVKARVQTHDHGSQFYNAQRQQEEPTFEKVYHVCWRVMFTPAPAVAKLIEQQINDAGLVPGNYAGIHIRALYAVEERDPALIQQWTQNAIHCASQLQPGGPFYLSSDSSHAVTVGKEYGKDRQVQVAARNSNGVGREQPYHLDKAPKSAKAADFYDTFVDLYLLALSRCITYNMGGFGTWALYISPYANRNDGACSFQHHEASGIHKCEFVAVETRRFVQAGTPTSRKDALFLPPMK